MHPPGRGCLQISQKLRQRTIWAKLSQQVNVIFRAVQFQGNTPELANRSAEVIIYRRTS
jgi:hypothetical protein